MSKTRSKTTKAPPAAIREKVHGDNFVFFVKGLFKINFPANFFLKNPKTNFR